jgi:hypothetical protein
VITNEVFLPVSIFATSDGGQSTANSDHLQIFTGFFGQPNPVPTTDAIIPEPTPEGPEPRLPFATGALFFDLLQPNSTSDVSDYVDLPNGITGFFLSSENQADYLGLPTPDGVIPEDPLNGATVHYSVGFASDTEVPEPSSIALAGVGMLGLVGVVGRRRRALFAT